VYPQVEYFPYKSDRTDKKYYIITNDNKKVYFGQASASDFTLHKNEASKNLYINRHRKTNLNSGINQELILLHFGPAFYYGRNQQ